MFELRHKLPNNWMKTSGLRTWVETLASPQSLLQKLILSNSTQNLHKNKHQSFMVLSNFAWFSYLLPSYHFIDCLYNLFAHNLFQFPSNLKILIFFQSLCQAFIGNVNKTSYGKVLNLTVFCRHYFACLFYVKNWY